MVARSRSFPPLCFTSEALRLGLSLLLEELKELPFGFPMVEWIGARTGG